MRCIAGIFFATCLFLGNGLSAEEPVRPLPPQPSPFQGHLEIYASVPVPQSVNPTVAPRSIISPSDKVIHLCKAAKELEAAGLIEEAARFRKMADELHPASKIDKNSQVILELTVMEVSLTKLQKLGLDAGVIMPPQSMPTDRMKCALPKMAPPQPLPPTHGEQNSPLIKTVSGLEEPHISARISAGTPDIEKQLAFLKKLREDGLVEVVAEPKLVTLSGRPASFHSGGEVQVAIPQPNGTVSTEWKKYGTQADFVPVILGNGKLRIELRASLSNLVDEAGNPVRADDKKTPLITSREIDTACEVDPGQVVILGGLVSVQDAKKNSPEPKDKPDGSEKNPAPQDREKEKSMLIFLLKAEVVEPMK